MSEGTLENNNLEVQKILWLVRRKYITKSSNNYKKAATSIN